MSIALGFIGALLGTWLARLLALPDLFVLHVGGHGFPIIWSIIGAALFVTLLSLLTPGGRPGFERVFRTGGLGRAPPEATRSGIYGISYLV